MTDIQMILQYVKETYNTLPDYPFSDNSSAVLRQNNGKWYALLMRICPNRLGLSGKEPIDVINLKCDPLLIGSIRNERNIFPAYHMNKYHWITVIPAKTEPAELFELLDLSYTLTYPKH